MADLSIASPILGALTGGVARLVPEMLNFFDRKNRRKHELDLGTQQLELVKTQGATRLAEIDAQSIADQTTKSIDALSAVLQAQAKPTGIRWIDAINSAVRPIWTYLVLLSWASVKITNTLVALVNHLDWEKVQPLIWGGDETTMMSTLLTFWFLDRVLVKQAK